MVHVARGTAKTVTDIPDRIAAAEMAKKHVQFSFSPFLFIQ
jgi:hypothetical protein